MKISKTNKLSGAASDVFAKVAAEDNRKAVSTTINIGFILFGTAVLGVAGYAFYTLYWKNRFKKMKYNPKAAPSNVPPAAALAKANALYAAMRGAGTNEKEIYKTLAGVNYNGFIAIYNAFGKRSGALNFSLGNSGDEDLLSFLQGDLSEKDLATLRNLMASDARSLF